VRYLFTHLILLKKRRAFLLISRVKEGVNYDFVLEFSIERLTNKTMIVDLLAIRLEK